MAKFKTGDKVVFSEACTRGEKYDFVGVVVGPGPGNGEWVVSLSPLGHDTTTVFDEADIALLEEEDIDISRTSHDAAEYADMMEDYGMTSDALAEEYAEMAIDDHDADYL